MWVEFLLSTMAIGMIACSAYFIGYDKCKKDSQKEVEEVRKKHEEERTKWINERCDLISEIIELKEEHYLTD